MRRKEHRGVTVMRLIIATVAALTLSSPTLAGETVCDIEAAKAATDRAKVMTDQVEEAAVKQRQLVARYKEEVANAIELDEAVTKLIREASRAEFESADVNSMVRDAFEARFKSDETGEEIDSFSSKVETLLHRSREALKLADAMTKNCDSFRPNKNPAL